MCGCVGLEWGAEEIASSMIAKEKERSTSISTKEMEKKKYHHLNTPYLQITMIK